MNQLGCTQQLPGSQDRHPPGSGTPLRQVTSVRRRLNFPATGHPLSRPHRRGSSGHSRDSYRQEEKGSFSFPQNAIPVWEELPRSPGPWGLMTNTCTKRIVPDHADKTYQRVYILTLGWKPTPGLPRPCRCHRNSVRRSPKYAGRLPAMSNTPFYFKHHYMSILTISHLTELYFSGLIYSQYPSTTAEPTRLQKQRVQTCDLSI